MDPSLEERSMLQWLRSAIRIPGFTADKWKEHDGVALTFLCNAESKLLVAYMTGEGEFVLLCPYSLLPVSPRTFQYFIKRGVSGVEGGKGEEGGVQPPLTMSTLRSCLQMGFVNGGGVDSLMRLMSSVFMPSLRVGGGSGGVTGDGVTAAVPTPLMDGPASLWPVSVRRDFVGQAQRFMASLVETHHQVLGATVLYVSPDEDLTTGVEDKELIQRLEASLIHWTRQIKEAVSQADSASAGSSQESGGPLDELAYYTSRCDNLSGATAQLQSPRLQQILSLLKEAGSAYLPPFLALSHSIRQSFEESSDNVKFLGTLKPICDTLASATPSTIPTILPELLSRVRVIGSISRHYCTPERLTSLCRRVSNEVLRRCAAAIDVREVFEGDPGVAMGGISECVACLTTWRALFFDTVEAVTASSIGKTPRGQAWTALDTGSIFAQVEAFSQRCNDLVAVCQAQVQYARKSGMTQVGLPPVGGLKGVEVLGQLVTVEKTFSAHVTSLKSLETCALDVKALSWREAQARVRSGIKDLENMYGGIITEAFMEVNSVTPAVALLEVFSSLAKSPAVLRAVEVKAGEVLTLFSKVLAEGKSYFEANAASPPLTDGSSRFGGAALWSRGLQGRMAADWRLVKGALAYLPPMGALGEEVVEAWGKLDAGLEEYQRGRYTDWVHSLQDLDHTKVTAMLATPLLSRCGAIDAGGSGAGRLGGERKEGKGARVVTPLSQAPSPLPYLRSNFPRRITDILRECEIWEGFGGKFEAPRWAAELLGGSAGENLRQIRGAVLLATGDYNTLVSSMDDVEGKLLADIVRRLDRKLQPGLTTSKVTWLLKSVKDGFLSDMRRSVSEVWTVLQEFKVQRARVGDLVTSFSSLSLLHLDRNSVHDEGVFEARQVEHRTKVKGQLEKLHRDVASLLAKCYSVFAGEGVGVQRAWARWVRAMDVRVEASLKTLVTSSLDVLKRAICTVAPSGGEGKGGHGHYGGGGVGATIASSASFLGSSTARGGGVGGGGREGTSSSAILPSGEEVRPVFRVYFTLEGSTIAPRPTMDTLTAMLIRECQEVIACVTVVPRLEDVLPVVVKRYSATAESIRIMAGKAAAAAQLGPSRRLGAAVAALEEEDFPLGSAQVEAGGKASFPSLPSFHALISATPILSEVATAIEESVAELGARTESKERGELQSRASKLTLDRAIELQRFEKVHYNQPLGLATIKQYLDEFQGIEVEMREALMEEESGFLLVDRSRIKAEFAALCQEWRKAYVGMVQRKSGKEVSSLLDRMEESRRLISVQATNLDDLRRNLKIIQDTKREVQSVFHDRFTHLESAYALISSFEATLDDAELTRLASLRPTFDLFTQELEVGEENIKRSKDAMRSETVAGLSGFSTLVEDLKASCVDPSEGLPYTFEPTVQEAKESLGAWGTRLAGLRVKEKTLEPAIEVFELPPPDYSILATLEEDLKGLEVMWSLVEGWETDWGTWKTESFSKLDVPGMEESAGKTRAKLVKLREYKKWKVWGGLEAKVKDFLLLTPLIQSLSNPAMRPRHWEQLVKEVGVVFDPTSEDFSLEKMFDMGLSRYADFISDLSNAANKELAIEEALKDISKVWSTLDLDIVEYKGVYFKLRSTEDLYQTMEDHAVSVSAMKASPSAAVFGEELEKWEKTLSLVSEVVDMQLQVQKKWMYLESIFMASEDIRKMLPAEAGWFEEVNATFNRIMGRCAANRNALAACTVPGFLEEQEGMDATLERIQKALDSYLELKRQQFPRFYFLSNDDLLEILGQSKDPMQVQKHIKKCFEGIQSLHINEPGTAGNACHEAVGMTAPDGERVPFERKVMVKGAVEMWLIEVERAMIFGLARLVGIEEWVGTKEGCFFKAKKNKADPEKLKWIKEFPGQLLITAGMMHFVKNCEDALRHKESPGKQLKKRKRWQVELLTKLAEIVRDKLDKVSRKKVVALITMEIHARDVMERMIKARCSGLEDFEWLSQLRLEPVTVRNENHPYGTIAAKQTKSTLEFGFEYQGNNGRLVVTPLTDRCVLTLTTALYMQRGGAPAGPAGTGKTETVKDLGKNLAKFVVVFNCSDGLDYKSVGRMFSGLVQSGGWGCFDEFNRIEVEVLSVIAQQVLSVMEAIRSRKHVFDFMGLRIKCNWQCGIFITMNPGYAGRSELPDNLKSLFRPVAMMVPDLALIAEVMLQSEGFENSRVLAKKTVTLYSLMIQQLSKQDHYDYSLRSLRGVLVCAGALKRSPTPPSGAPTDPKLLEDFIVLRAIRDMNLPKFIKVDADLFRLLLKDLFPALELPPFDPGDLGAAIAAELDKAGLQQNPTILQKCIELRDSKVTRHCNMLVGKTLAGKSTTWRMLAAACTQLAGAKVEGFLKVRVESINPKSIEMKELYGAYDLQTMEWQDGILSSVFREYARDDRNEEKWLMLDGPVDTLWIESMNTVMDDNKVLTLINGDRIGMTETMSLLFECQDLSVASPATVSRAGMVYIDEADLGWGPFVSSWTSRVFKGQGAPFIDFMGSLFQKYCPRLLRFKRRECKELIPLGDFHAVLSLCNLLDALWAIPENGLKGGGGGEDKAFLAYVERWFAFACVWSLGGCVDEAGRKKFNEGMREFEGVFPPGASTVYDFSVDPASKDFKPWSDRLTSSWRPPRDLPLSKIIVPTIDTVRNTFVMAALVSKGYHFLSIGNTGTGKSALSQVHLEGMSTESFSKSVMYFSAATSSTAVQEIIEGCLEKKSKNKMGPPAGKRLLLLVDDLNMPKKDTFGSQPPLELLRQWLDYGGWYDRGKQAWRNIVDMQLMSAMGPPGGGRTQISERLQSRFSMVNFTFPAEKETKKIFETILVSRLGDFGEEVLRLVPGVVAATLKVYEGTVESFLPTPACSHYLFNLRDIANVMKGLLSLNARNVESKEAFLLAWSHECTRVFADRFVNGEDFKKFFNILDVSLHKATEVYVKSLWEGCENPTLGPIFLSFVGNDAPLVPAEGGEERPPYKELRGSVDVLRGAVEEDMMEYNSTPGYLPLNLVFFKDALRHVARIHRMLRSPRGNALLVGVGGSGRQSLTRVAAFLTKDAQGNRMGVFSIEITKLYRKLEFHEDLKRLYNRTGVEGRPTCFLFSDTQIKEEGFLEDINNILNSGEVPNLFTKDERGAVIDTMRPLAKKLGLVMPGGGTGDELWGFFIQRVRENLHLVLAMSPVGDAFRNRCRMYPSLVNCTTIDWFLEWPSDALREVAAKFLDDVRLAPPKLVVVGGGVEAAATAAPGAPSASATSSSPFVDPELTLKGQIATVFAELHLSVIVSSRRMLLQLKRYNYVTPTNYLELVKGYRELVTSKLKELGDQRDKLSNGLSKLESSKVQVEEMQVTLAEKQKVVEKSSADCDALLVKIVQEKRVADEQKAEVEETSARIDVEAAKCKAIADDANADLAEALPALEAAMSAVDRLDKSSITEVKSFANPPEPVKLCLEAVCILFKRPPTWDEAKKKMNESDFLQQVKGFDKDNVDPGVLKRLRKYTEMRVGVGGAKIDFTSDFINSKSSAAGALATWCLAIEKYSEVAKTVAPKKAILHAAEKALEEKMAALNKAKLLLAEVVAKVDALNAKHIESVTEKTRLTLEAATLQDKLERAENLIGGLSGERVRWEASIQRYESLLRNAPGDALIAAGFLSYAGPFDAVYRGDLVAGWLGCVKNNGVPASDDFNFATFLADPSDVRDWNIQGLPSDQFSTENGVIVTRGRRWPLMVDPQGQANKWVKEKEKKRGIKVTDLKAKDFLRELEGAITYGLPYLLQDVEEDLDPALEPVLTKSVVKRGTREVLKLGDKELDFNPAFKLYITTKLANPHYTPEVSTKVTIVNFAVKEQGLEAQLLGAVVREEQPILEQEKSRLVVSVAAGKRKLQELENTILRLLSEVQGSLLDDKDIVVVLQASKTTSEEVTASLEVSEATEKKIDAAREGYRPVATRASLLYFVLNDLALVDSMYQFSLDAYNLLFLQSIQESRRLAKKTGTEAFDDEEGGAEVLHRRRIADINEHHTLEVYKYACRGLFERHKLLLSFQVCVRMQQVEGGGGKAGGGGGVDSSIYDWFLKGAAVLDRTGQRHNPAPSWITPTTWDAITDLEKLDPFVGLAAGVESYVPEWGAWFYSPTPERMPLPGEWEGKCDDLMRLTLVRAIRSDRVLSAVARYVSSNLGPAFVEPPPFDLKAIYESSTNVTPLVFILSPGVDPTTEVLQLSAAQGVNLEYCSLGQGQAPIAERMLTDALKKGGWVFLQNCHLSISWMPTLEKLIDALCEAASKGGSNAPHKNFRLWLSSSPHPAFPIAILQRAIKLTTEPPRGIRANIIRLYNLLDPVEFAARSAAAPGTYAKLLFSLSWFHALLLERKKFKSLGWCIAYDFNNSDYLLAADILNDYLAVPTNVKGGGGGVDAAAAAAALLRVPWDAIRYLIAEVTYGGRVTDDYDRRLVSTYTSQYFCEEVVTTPYYKLSSLPDYYIPDDGSVANYKDFVNQMASSDPPEAFGQHPNADIQSAILDTADLLGTVLSLQPRAIAGEGARPEDKVAALCVDLEKQLPDLFDVEMVRTSVAPRGDPEPLKVVLYQECERYNKLLSVMKRTLSALRKGIAGTVVITSELEQLFDALLVGRVPGAWGFAYPSLKPLGLWVRDLLDRLKQLHQWVSKGMPGCFWLSGFTYPTGFLTAMLQTSARANGLAIDNLEFEYPIVLHSPEHLKEGPAEGQYIKGLFLEGAQWSREDACLCEPEPMQLFAPMPVVHFKPIEARRERTRGIYKCPMYLYPVRTGTRERPSYMGVVDLRCAEGVDPSTWIKRGTAILLALAS